MFLEPERILEFRRLLLAWYAAAKRDLPWRRTTDPYAVWISEIMLQQTRVAAVIPYYNRFLARFPDFRSLAECSEADLLAHWSGLGYYYRARNLQKAAAVMIAAGTFPATYDEIRALPGIGDYTAAAIASIGFGLPHAAVDGNVLRVLSRLQNDSTDIASVEGKKKLTAVANCLLDCAQPGEYNQALMELGATVCLPRDPQCLMCPVSSLCDARAHGVQNALPVKRKAARNGEEQRTIYWIERNNDVLAWKRPPEASLMPGFWELPEPEHLPDTLRLERLGDFRHSITVHNYRFTVYLAPPPATAKGCEWISIDNLDALPVSSVLRKAAKLVTKVGRREASEGTSPPQPDGFAKRTGEAGGLRWERSRGSRARR
jgi:A/G-specific adenine glycosylase